MSNIKKYFGTDGIRGRVGDERMTPDFVLQLGWAAGEVFRETGYQRVLIGKDTRISGYMIESALEAGLSAAGIDVYLVGPMPTPGIAFLIRSLRMDCGIVISASHNPYHDNGLKFFDAASNKISEELELAIEAKLQQKLSVVSPENIGKAHRVTDAAARYIEFCKHQLTDKHDLTGLKIVLDCANGATYHIAPKVFEELGAAVISLAASPDGFNINKACGSLYPTQLQTAVLEHQADLGIAFDGDGDRVLMVDQTGEIIDGDQMLYIIAKDQLQKGLLMGGVVGTLMTNYGLERALAQLDIPFTRTSVGDRHVLAELTQRDWFLGGENSGHIICRDRVTTGDGIVAALQVINAMLRQACSLKTLLGDMQKYPQIMVNVKTSHPVDPLTFPEVVDAVRAIETTLGEQGRVVLRRSGTEPLIRVMLEGQDQHQIKGLAEELAAIVEQVANVKQAG